MISPSAYRVLRRIWDLINMQQKGVGLCGPALFSLPWNAALLHLSELIEAQQPAFLLLSGLPAERILHIQPVMALAHRRELIEPVALMHIGNLLLAGGIHPLMHDKRSGGRALEVHLTKGKAMLRAF